jgi:hypothetical protein
MSVLQELLAGGVDAGRFLLRQKYGFAPRQSEEIVSFLFPQSPFPVYFLLDYKTYEEQWFRWGRASFSEGDKFSYTMVPIQYIYQEGSMIKGRSDLGDVSFDLVRGVGTVGSQTDIFLKQVRVHGGQSVVAKNYHEKIPHGLALPSLLIKQGKHLTNGILLDDSVFNTIFTEMLLMERYDPAFFVPVLNESPLIAVYQVRGDVYTPQQVQ